MQIPKGSGKKNSPPWDPVHLKVGVVVPAGWWVVGGEAWEVWTIDPGSASRILQLIRRGGGVG